MLRLIALLIFLININSYSQTQSYLEDERSPGSVEDIIKLLNLKHAKKISIFSQDGKESTFLGEIFLNKEGKCIKKHSCQRNNIYHTYDSNGNLKEYIFFLRDSMNFRHYEYRYNKNGDLIEMVLKDKSGLIIESVRDTLNLAMHSVPVTPQIPRYKSNSGNYTYNSDGYLIKYYAKGFYLPSSKSNEEAKFKENEKEYKLEYNSENQIIKYYKKIQRKSSKCEVTTKFSYISDNLIEIKSNHSDCRCISCYENLIYKIEYY